MHPAPSDADLVETARNGDRSAFAELVSRHYPLLFALCRQALGNAALAEDAAQEATFQALLSLERLHRPDRFGAWLMAIGLNMCRRHMRRRTRDAWSWESVLGGRLVAGLIEARPGPEELVETAELRARVRRAIAGLPPGQRSAVLHFYLADLSHAETATELGIEVGAVKTRLHKARRTLRSQLLENWKEDGMDRKVSRRTINKAAGAIAGAAAVGKLADASAAGGAQAVEMRLMDVRRYRSEGSSDYTHVCYLKEVGGERTLPIWIGEFEATSLALLLEGVPSTRPMAYAFAAGLLSATGGQLREVHINRLEDEVFYAEAVVEGPEGAATVDARPSDALNLALLANAPILVDAAVIAKPMPEPVWQTDTADGSAVLAAIIVEKWSAPRPER